MIVFFMIEQQMDAEFMKQGRLSAELFLFGIILSKESMN
jgi:hypothetical protein